MTGFIGMETVKKEIFTYKFVLIQKKTIKIKNRKTKTLAIIAKPVNILVHDDIGLLKINDIVPLNRSMLDIYWKGDAYIWNGTNTQNMVDNSPHIGTCSAVII